MSYKELKIEQVITQLSQTGHVPLDDIFELTAMGVDFSTLDAKYNQPNQ